MIRLISCMAVLAVMFLAYINTAAGDEWNQVYVGVSPSVPTESARVTLDAWTWFGDPGQRFASASYSIDSFHIDMDVIMQDLHAPGLVWVQVMTSGGGSVNCGTLPQGHYDVLADILVRPWSGGEPVLLRSGSTSFDVIPAPTPSPVIWKGGSSSGPFYWTLAENWLPGTAAPNGPATDVAFGNQGSAPLVWLNAPEQTVGNITFNSSVTTSIQSTGGYNLTLDNYGRVSTITATGHHTIGVPVVLDNDVNMNINGTLTLSGKLSGPHAVSVSGGELKVGSIAADSLTLGAGATVTVQAISGGPTGGAITPVPEPSALALLASAFILLALVRAKKSPSA
jgi:hypothetical protein